MPSSTPAPDPAPADVLVTFVLQAPVELTGRAESEIIVPCRRGESILQEALRHGINIEHACGGVCACSTCHIYVNRGREHLTEPADDELDRVEEAPDLQRNSRLACQCIIQGAGPITVEVPAWNRNAVKETPH